MELEQIAGAGRGIATQGEMKLDGSLVEGREKALDLLEWRLEPIRGRSRKLDGQISPRTVLCFFAQGLPWAGAGQWLSRRQVSSLISRREKAAHPCGT